jgi:hypothetical protein
MILEPFVQIGLVLFCVSICGALLFLLTSGADDLGLEDDLQKATQPNRMNDNLKRTSYERDDARARALDARDAADFPAGTNGASFSFMSSSPSSSSSSAMTAFL